MTAGEHTIAQKHLRGVSAVVDSSGGVKGVGLTGLLERMYGKFMRILEVSSSSGTGPTCTAT